MIGTSNVLSMEDYLDVLGSKPHLLEQKFDRCFEPLDISEFADTNGKQATIQLSIVHLLLAAAKSQIKSKQARL